MRVLVLLMALLGVMASSSASDREFTPQAQADLVEELPGGVRLLGKLLRFRIPLEPRSLLRSGS